MRKHILAVVVLVTILALVTTVTPVVADPGDLVFEGLPSRGEVCEGLDFPGFPGTLRLVKTRKGIYTAPVYLWVEPKGVGWIEPPVTYSLGGHRLEVDITVHLNPVEPGEEVRIVLRADAQTCEKGSWEMVVFCPAPTPTPTPTPVSPTPTPPTPTPVVPTPTPVPSTPTPTPSPEVDESWFLIRVETVQSVQPGEPPFKVWTKNWTDGSHREVSRVQTEVWFERYLEDEDCWEETDEAWFISASLVTRNRSIEVSGSFFVVDLGTVGPYGEDEIHGNFEIDPWARPGRIALRAKVTWICPYTGKIGGNEAGAVIEVLPWQGRIRVLSLDGTYTVQMGDTLYSIARSFGTTIEAIALANNIINPNLIYVGQRLVIP